MSHGSGVSRQEARVWWDRVRFPSVVWSGGDSRRKGPAGAIQAGCDSVPVSHRSAGAPRARCCLLPHVSRCYCSDLSTPPMFIYRPGTYSMALFWTLVILDFFQTSVPDLLQWIVTVYVYDSGEWTKDCCFEGYWCWCCRPYCTN